MNKEFAFLFYVNDWAGGTQWLNRLQRGAYIDLLLYQVNNICFTIDNAKHILGDDFDTTWPALKSKFIEENGNFYNKKMRDVLEKRSAFIESRRRNKLGKGKKDMKKISKTYDKHMVKEKEIEIVFDNKEWKALFEKWINYRIVIKKPIKEISKQAAYDELKKLSHGNISNAERIVQISIANSYQGLFELKDSTPKESKIHR